MSTLRGTGIQASSASSYSVSWPAGTLAGDTALIFAGGGFVATAPSNWSTYDNPTGINWNGSLFTKLLSAADITSGSVSVSFAGTFDSVLAIATMVGSCIVTQVVSQRNGPSPPNPVTLTTSSAVLTTDFALYFGSNRGTSTDTVNRGTNQRQADDGSAAAGCLYTEDLSAVTPPFSAIFSYSSAGAGNYQAIAIVSPLVMAAPKDIPITWSSGASGGVSRLFVNPGLNGGMNG